MIIKFLPRYSRHISAADRPTTPVFIQCRIGCHGEYATDFSTKVAVLIDDWDAKEYCVLASDPEHKTKNHILQTIREKLRIIWNKYEYDETLVSAQEIRSQYLEKAKPKRTSKKEPISPPTSPAPKPVYTLEQLLNEHLAHLETLIQPDTEDRTNGLALASWKAYRRYRNLIVKYLKATTDKPGKPPMVAPDVDADWMKSFQEWLTKSKYDKAYIAKNLGHVKTALSWGALKKYIQFNPIAGLRVERHDNEDELVFLMPHEEAMMEIADFNDYPVLEGCVHMCERVRDAWLVMRDIGQHYSDFRAFVDNPTKYVYVVFGIRFYKKRRKKTKQWALVPITDRLKRLEKKYGGLHKLPRPSLNDVNTHIKLIAAALGIQKSLSSKSARKTFADYHINEFKNKDNQRLMRDDVAAMMGLSSTKYLNRYGRVDERRLIQALGLTPGEEKPIKK